MTSQPGTDSNHSVLWEVESGIATLACHAAIELDNIIEDQVDGVEAVRKLAAMMESGRLEQGVQTSFPKSLLDPMTELAMSQAINVSALLDKPLVSIDDLIVGSDQIAQWLNETAQDPLTFKRDRLEDLKKMRSFCLALSEGAWGIRQSPYEPGLQHPFRA
jgi:hypothetical protein